MFFKNTDPQPAEILPWLWLGTYQHARDRDTLDRLGITHVLDVENGGSKPDHLNPNVYLASPMCDFGGTQVDAILDDCFRFLDGLRDQSPDHSVLIQCEWGVNRSTTITLAYLMKAERMPLKQAASLVKSRRKQARPRDGYLEQLVAIEERLLPDLDADQRASLPELLAIFADDEF